MTSEIKLDTRASKILALTSANLPDNWKIKGNYEVALIIDDKEMEYLVSLKELIEAKFDPVTAVTTTLQNELQSKVL